MTGNVLHFTVSLVTKSSVGVNSTLIPWSASTSLSVIVSTASAVRAGIGGTPPPPRNQAGSSPGSRCCGSGRGCPGSPREEVRRVSRQVRPRRRERVRVAGVQRIGIDEPLNDVGDIRPDRRAERDIELVGPALVGNRTQGRRRVTTVTEAVPICWIDTEYSARPPTSGRPRRS